MASISVVQGLRNSVLSPFGSQDFQWHPARTMLQHKNPYTEFIEYWQQKKGPNPYILEQTPNYPASTLVFLLPYALFDWETAKTAWAISNLICTALILIGLNKLYPLESRKYLLILTALFLLNTPYRMIINNGQHTLFALAAFIWSLVLRPKNKILAGICLALSWLKYSITFPLTLLFIAKREFKIPSIAISLHVVLTCFVALWIGESPEKFFFQPLEVNWLTTAPGDVDVFGLARTYHIPLVIPSVVGIALLILLGFVMVRWDRKNESLLLTFLSLISLVFFYHLRYDFVILVLPLWYLFTHGVKSGTDKILIVLIAISWAIQKVVDLIVRYGQTSMSDMMGQAFHLITVTLIYSLIVMIGKDFLSSNRKAITDER